MSNILTKFLGSEEKVAELRGIKELHAVIFDINCFERHLKQEVDKLHRFLENWNSRSADLKHLSNVIKRAIKGIRDEEHISLEKEESFLEVEHDFKTIVEDTKDVQQKLKIASLLNFEDKNWKKLKDIIRKKVEFINKHSDKDIGVIHHNIGELIALLKEEGQLIEIEKDVMQRISELEEHLGTYEKIKARHGVFQKWAKIWNNKFIKDLSDEREIKKRSQDFAHVCDVLTGKAIVVPINPIKSSKEIDAFMEEIVKVYDFAYSNNLFPDNSPCGGIYIALQHSDPDQIIIYKEFIQKIIPMTDQDLRNKFQKIVFTYALHHRLDKSKIQGLVNKLLPVIARKDEQVQVLLREGNVWGMQKGDFGLADFTCHCYALKVSPSNINELLMALREIPTSDYRKLEQNRIDGGALSSQFSAIKDFIHDQRPLVHEVIKEMIRYYETGDATRLKKLLSETRGYLGSKERQEMILDRSRYDKIFDYEVNYSVPEKMKIIDILRRVQNNTMPVTIQPPVTSDNELNSKMKAILECKEKIFSKEKLRDALDYTNALLIDMMRKNEIGLEPNTLLAIAWLERNSYFAIQSPVFEEMLGCYKQAWFHSILKFHELTFSAKEFDENEVETYIKKVTDQKSDTKAFKLVGKRVLRNLSELADKYKTMKKKHWVDALWSGNTADALLSLLNFGQATTKAGERLKEEMIKPEWDQPSGD